MHWQKKTENWFHCPYKGIEITVIQADITSEQVDAIVNAANEHLAHGGGVAGAISSKGGYDIQRESDEYVRRNGPVDTGNVGLTGPGRLPCKHVIHAVGPVWHDRTEDDVLLENAIFNSFLKADELKLKNISIPAISSGIFGYPKPRCAMLMIRTVKKYIDQMGENSTLKEIRLTNFDHETSELMDKELRNFSANPEKEIVLPEIVKRSWNYGYSYSSWGSGSSNFYNSKPKQKENDEVKAEDKPVSKAVVEKKNETETESGVPNRLEVWKRDVKKKEEDENKNITEETNEESEQSSTNIRKTEPDTKNMEVD